MIPVERERYLVNKTKLGDQVSFEVLELESRSKVNSYLQGSFKNELETEEIYQKGIIKAWKRIKQFKGNCRFSTWLCKICKNIALDDIKKAKRKKTESLNELMDTKTFAENLFLNKQIKTASTELEFKEFKEQLSKAMSRLTPTHRDALKMLVDEGASYAEIASRQNVSMGTVMSRIHHAKKQTRKFYNAMKG